MKALIAVLFLIGCSITLAQNAQQTQIAGGACTDLERSGALRVDKDLRKAWIDPLLWYQMDAQQKEITTEMIASCVSPANPMVDLFDKQSAKKLATYGPFRGFRIEQ